MVLLMGLLDPEENEVRYLAERLLFFELSGGVESSNTHLGRLET